ncbi:MAG TPA: hypothetical protein VFZ67_04970 [Nitrososphaera sp.]
MLIGSIIALFLAVILFAGFLIPSLAMAQQQQQTTTTTTTSPPPLPLTSSSPSLSITTATPPLTPEEQEEQNRLQNVIAATTANLNETQKQVSGVVFTPRWSEPVWINANSIAVLIAYCFPGEFADSGQEILGGFELEVLESYAIALPQGFMAWMAVVGNEDQQNRRFPAAVGVICASDLNNADTRVLSPQEQQAINNVISQFSTIQNTQITNIDQVINIINNVTTPAQNDTGGVTEPSFIAEIIPNGTSGFIFDWFELKSNVTGGTEPYTYLWEYMGISQAIPCPSDPSDRCKIVTINRPGTSGVSLTVTDSKNQTASDSVQITVEELPPFTVEIITSATQGFPGDTIRFDANKVGGPPDEYCSWEWTRFGAPYESKKSFNLSFVVPGTYTFAVTASCYPDYTPLSSDTVQITIRARPQELLGEGVLDNATVAGEGRGGETSSREGGEETGEPLEEPGVPSPTVPDGGEEIPPSDDTGDEEGGEEGGTPSSTEEEPSSPPGDGTGGG